MKEAQDDKCDYSLLLTFSSTSDLMKMIEKAIANDKEWGIERIEFFKKEIMEKAAHIIERRDGKQRSIKLLNESTHSA